MFLSDKIAPEKFGLYKFDVKGGHREIVFGPKKQPKPIRLDVTRLDKGLYRLEVERQPRAGRVLAEPGGVEPGLLFPGELSLDLSAFDYHLPEN